MTFDLQIQSVDPESKTLMAEIFNGELPKEGQLFHAKQISENDRQRDDVRALFFCLCEYVLRYLELMPEQCREMITGDNKQKNKDLISLWLRYKCNYFETKPNANWQMTEQIKSLDNNTSSKDDLSDLLRNAEQVVGSYLGKDMDRYFHEHAEARRKLGREE